MPTVVVQDIGEFEVGDEFMALSASNQQQAIRKMVEFTRSQSKSIPQAPPSDKGGTVMEGAIPMGVGETTQAHPVEDTRSHTLGGALMSGLTNDLPGAIQGGIAAMGSATGLLDEDVVASLRKAQLRNKAEAAAEYSRPPEVAPSVSSGWRKDGLKGAGEALGFGVAEGLPSAVPGAVASLGKRTPWGAVLATGVNIPMIADSVLSERRKHDPKAELSSLDWANIAAQAGIDIIPYGKEGLSWIKKQVWDAGKEGLQNAAQEGLTIAGDAAQGGEHNAQEVADRLIEAGATGAASAPAAKAAMAVPGAIKAAPGAIITAAQTPGMVKSAKASPERFESDLRVQEGFRQEKASIVDKDAKTDDAEVFRNQWKRTKEEFKETAKALYEAGDVSPEQYDALVRREDSVINMAGKHTQELSSVDIDKIAGIGLQPDASKTLIGAALDINTIADNAQHKKKVGPLEASAKQMGGPAARVLAGIALGAPGGITGAAIGAAGGALAAPAGRFLDRALGLSTPPVLRKQAARARAAEKLGISPTTTMDRLSAIRDEAKSRAGDVVILPRNYLLQRQVSVAAKERRDAHQAANEASRKATMETKAAERAAEQAMENLRREAGLDNAAYDRAFEQLRKNAEWDNRDFDREVRKAAKEAGEPDATAEQLLAEFNRKDASRAQREAVSAAKKFYRERQREEVKAKAKEAKEAEAADKAQAKADEVAANASTADKAGELARSLGAPRLGGWLPELIENATRGVGFQVNINDVKAGMDEFVKKGIVSEQDAHDVFTVPGSSINPESKVYYALQEVAALKAAQRNGVNEITPEVLAKAKERNAIEEAKHRAKARDAVAADRKETSKEKAAERKANRSDEAVAKAKETARKAAATRAANREKPKEKPSEDQKQSASERLGSASPHLHGIRNEPSYRATVDTAQALMKEAMASAPTDALKGAVARIEDARTKVLKKAILADIRAGNPQHAEWIDKVLGPLAGIGGGR